MFTIEIKINGAMIGHIYGVNSGPSKDSLKRSDLYRYEYYQVGDRRIKNGSVNHAREDGIERLVVTILEDAINKKGHK